MFKHLMNFSKKAVLIEIIAKIKHHYENGLTSLLTNSFMLT